MSLANSHPTSRPPRQSLPGRGGEGRVLTEVNDHLAVAAPHVRRQGKDTGHVVVEERLLLLKPNPRLFNSQAKVGLADPSVKVDYK